MFQNYFKSVSIFPQGRSVCSSCPWQLVSQTSETTRLSLARQKCLGIAIGNKIVTVHKSSGEKWRITATVLRTPFPLTALKNARNPKFVRNLSQRLFLGVPVRGTEIWKNLSKFVRKLPFFKFRQIFPNFSPPDWNPQNQSLGQISDKFWVSGVFQGCKGERGSQL